MLDPTPPTLSPFTMESGPIRAPQLASVISIYQDSSWLDVRYFIDGPGQSCYRDRGRNVVCEFLPKSPPANPTADMAIGGKSKVGRIFCPAGFSHFIDSCIKLPAAAEPWSLTSCTTKDTATKTLTVSSFYLYEGLKAMSSAQSGPSFWVGGWPEVSSGPLALVALWQAGGQEAAGDCVLADQAQGFLLRRAACTEAAALFCQASHECPPGFTSIPEAGANSCFKIADTTATAEPNLAVSSISTAHKVCLDHQARLAAPSLATEVTALKDFLLTHDVMVTGAADGDRDVTAWLGLQYFQQSVTRPPAADCPACATDPNWQDVFISPWSKAAISKADGQTILGLTASLPCHIIETVAGVAAAKASDCYTTFDRSTSSGTYALCEVRLCSPCVFPFQLAGRLYDTCTTVGSPDGTAWCSTEVDENGVHVEGARAPCPANCAVSDCPVGFMRHLSTCIQESASIQEDAPATVGQAEDRCLAQGGRLYQPRSKRTLAALKVKNKHFYATSKTTPGILGWAGADKQQTAFGVMLPNNSGSSDLSYKDGSSFPSALINSEFVWGSGFPDTAANKSCVTIHDKAFTLGNNDCEDFSPGSNDVFLAYICEARPYTTEKFSPNAGRPCHFPYRLEAGGGWRHSCSYGVKETGQDYAWCPTAVDDEGVMVTDTIGDCVDERNTAYAGVGKNILFYSIKIPYNKIKPIPHLSDADNTCKIPFFYDGVWFENCTLYPQDDYWCPTEVDPVTRIQTGGCHNLQMTERHTLTVRQY